MFKNTRDFVLEGQWMADTGTTENLKERFWLWGKLAVEKQHLSKKLQKKMFGYLKEIYWITKISLSAQRENNISSCFQSKKETCR